MKKQRISGYFQLISKTKSQNSNNNAWIKLTKLMKEHDYKMNKFELRQYSINMSKIITNCNNDINQIEEIHSLIKDKYDNDKYIKTALINVYGINGKKHIEKCLNLFNSIDNNEKDAFVIDAMMKIYIKHNQNDKALMIYDKYKFGGQNLTNSSLKMCFVRS